MPTMQLVKAPYYVLRRAVTVRCSVLVCDQWRFSYPPQQSSSSSSSCRYSSSATAPATAMDLLKDLRARTGAPIVDCKKALQHGGNDVQLAIDWLREHGAAKVSSKVAGRVSAEGLVGMSISSTHQAASLVKITSETDFAGRSAQFVQLVADISEATLHVAPDSIPKDDVTSLLTVTASNGKTIKDMLDDAIVSIRENISVADAMYLKASQPTSTFVGYVHNRVDPTVSAGTTAALVELVPIDKDNVTIETLKAIGKKLAMHIVAARPTYFAIPDVPVDVVEKERTILSNQVGNTQGKPPEIIDKIIQGKLRKFYESVCLLEQEHMIEEGNPKVATHLADRGVRLIRYEYLSI